MKENKGAAHRRIRNDVGLILGLLCVVLIAYGIYALTRSAGAYVTVTVNGEHYAEYPLSEERTIALPSYNGKGSNRLVIANGTARVTWADCPDQICVHHAPISLIDDAIVCLPHRVVVTVKEGQT